MSMLPLTHRGTTDRTACKGEPRAEPPRAWRARHRAAVAMIVLAGIGLAACSFPQALSQADRATLQTCRGDADRVYNAQNRAQLSQRDSRDSPFSGGGQAASPSDGLADQYSHERMVDDCVRHGALEPDQPEPPK